MVHRAANERHQSYALHLISKVSAKGKSQRIVIMLAGVDGITDCQLVIKWVKRFIGFRWVISAEFARQTRHIIDAHCRVMNVNKFAAVDDDNKTSSALKKVMRKISLHLDVCESIFLFSLKPLPRRHERRRKSFFL
jgi:hypothetical protein